MKGRITKRKVESVLPSQRDQFLWDTVLTGFGLKITPKGKRTYILQYRMGGRVRRYTIGRHGAPWAPEQARREAARLLGEVAANSDPAQAKSEARKEATVGEFCDFYLTNHVARFNKASTAKEFGRLVEKHIRRKLGKIKIRDVTRSDVAKFHRSMWATPRQANQTLAVLSKLCSLAEQEGARPGGSNPCRGLTRYPEISRERFLRDAELVRLGDALAWAEGQGVAHPSAILALRLLALTGCRLSEVINLKWDHIDFNEGVFRLADSKTGSREQPVGAHTLALLGTIEPVAGSPWVLDGRSPGNPISVSAVEAAWAKIRLRAELDDCRIHDLRHTVGTYAGQTGANAFLVRDKLGHKTVAMTGRYVSKDIDPLRHLNDMVESRISAALEGKPDKKVVAWRSVR